MRCREGPDTVSTLSLLSMLGLMPFAVALIATRTRKRQAAPEARASVTTEIPLDDAGFAGKRIDLSLLLSAVANEMLPMAREIGTRIGIAAGPGWVVHANPEALAVALRRTVEMGVRATPGGSVLLSVFALGGEIQIAVTDDGPGEDRLAREAAVREISLAIALRGGSVTVETRPEKGTTVTLRLLAPRLRSPRLLAPREPAADRAPMPEPSRASATETQSV